MNKNIEEIIKEALENHDSGYVSGAWESMQARLDGTTPTPFYKKWWVAAAFGTALVGSATYFAMNQDKSVEKETVAVSANVETTTSNDNVAKSNSNNTASVSTSSEEEKYQAPLDINGGYVIPHDHPTETPDMSKYLVHPNGMIAPPKKNIHNPTPIITVVDVEEKYEKLSLPTTVCLNEEVVIANPNDKLPIFVTEPSGRRVEVAANMSVTFTAKKPGTIKVKSGNHTDEIQVNQNTDKLYVDVDPSLLYEDGIPSLKFTVTGTTNSVSWESNIKGNEVKNEEFIVHPYTERVVTVNVTSKNEAGCTVEETQQVTINQAYNLLAPTGFYPNGSDERTNTFMPIALKERDVMFDMIIVDQKTGGTVFTTNDASHGWDGKDKTGIIAPMGSIWLWKVVLRNPNTGEPKEYSGTITVM